MEGSLEGPYLVIFSVSEGPGFKSLRIHQVPVSSCLRQSTKHPKKPALCGLSCFCLPPLVTFPVSFVVATQPGCTVGSNPATLENQAPCTQQNRPRRPATGRQEILRAGG